MICWNDEYYYGLWEFSTGVITGGFHWNPSDSESTQLSRILRCNFDNLSSAVVWKVSLLPQISSFFILFSMLLGIILSTPTMTGITVVFISLNFFLTHKKSSHIFRVFLLSFILTTRSGLLGGIEWLVFIPESQRKFCGSYSQRQIEDLLFFTF